MLYISNRKNRNESKTSPANVDSCASIFGPAWRACVHAQTRGAERVPSIGCNPCPQECHQPVWRIVLRKSTRHKTFALKSKTGDKYNYGPNVEMWHSFVITLLLFLRINELVKSVFMFAHTVREPYFGLQRDWPFYFALLCLLCYNIWSRGAQ